MQLLQLANEGINLMDAWLNTSVAEPLRMTAASSVPGSFADTDREGQITVAGYAAFATCVFEAGQCMTDRCMRNDADINGDADLDDYREMQFLIDSP